MCAIQQARSMAVLKRGQEGQGYLVPTSWGQRPSERSEQKGFREFVPIGLEAEP